jgi:hypothetical protein
MAMQLDSGRLIWLSTALVSLLGLVILDAHAGPPGPTIAEAPNVAGCRYLDTVVGASGLYGAFAAKGLERARAQVISKAKGLGATHIVWQETPQGTGSTQASAKAYLCGAPAPARTPGP